MKFSLFLSIFFKITLPITAALMTPGCAAPLKKVTTSPELNEYVFPIGNYTHQVRVHIPTNPDPKKREFQFRGVVRISPDVIRIVALSPVGSTLFKMSEERTTGKVSIETYVSSLKPLEGKLLEYYSALRVLLTARRNPRPSVFSETVGGEPTEFRFEKYDPAGIPTHLEIRSPIFSVAVEVVGYEL